MSIISGPLNLNYSSYQMTGATVPIYSEAVTFTFNKVPMGQSKAPYFNILQALVGVNGVNGMGTQENVYIGIHEPGSVFDTTPYKTGSVDMAIWDTSVTPVAKNGSVIGNWADGGANQRLINSNVNLVDGAVYTVKMEIVGSTLTGYVIDGAGVSTEIGSFTGLASAFQGFKNRIIVEKEFTSYLDSAQEPSSSTTVTNVSFNGSTANVKHTYNASYATDIASTQQTREFGNGYFETAAGASTNTVTLGGTNMTVIGGGVNSVLKLTAANHDLTTDTITGVGTLDVNGQSAIMTSAQYKQFTTITNNTKGITLTDGSFVAAQSVTTSLATDGSTIFTVDANGADVARLYTAGLNRKPDTSGLEYWINLHSSGKSLTDIASGFIHSAEFTSVFGDANTLSAKMFVEDMYNNVLHRSSDAAGAAYWEGMLASGQSQEVVLVGFSNSAENIANTHGWLVSV